MLNLSMEDAHATKDILKWMGIARSLLVNLDLNGILILKTAFLYVQIIEFGMGEAVPAQLELMISMEYVFPMVKSVIQIISISWMEDANVSLGFIELVKFAQDAQ